MVWILLITGLIGAAFAALRIDAKDHRQLDEPPEMTLEQREIARAVGSLRLERAISAAVEDMKKHK